MTRRCPGELAYIDDAGAVCRCWNWRDGVRTALSDDSADAFLAIECVEPERWGIARLPLIVSPSCSSAIWERRLSLRRL